MTKQRITRKDEGQPIQFQGFDGQTYQGNIVRVYRRRVSIEYPVAIQGSLRCITAHLLNADLGRIQFAA